VSQSFAMGEPRRRSASSLAVVVAGVCFGAAIRACYVSSSTFAVPRRASRAQIAEDSRDEAQASRPEYGEMQALSRRRVAGLAGVLAAAGGQVGSQGFLVHAEEAVDPAPGALPAALPDVSAKVQRVMVNVGNDEAMAKEIKFWTEAAQMKVLKDFVDTDKNRTVVLGFGPEASKDGGFFGVQVKIDPGVLTRRSPRLLNYDVMQPTVDALNFVQVGASGKIIEIFNRVQSSGGASLFGDATYIDVESPRGVPVRMVPREEPPSVELLSYNVEVPAFDPTFKFYQRALGFQQVLYPDEEPPVQKLSILLASKMGGPKVLLSPVPDGRLKEKALDEYTGLVMVSPSAKRVADAASAAVDLAEKEEAEKLRLENAKPRKKLTYEEQKEQRRTLKGAPGTVAEPSVEVDGTCTVIDDGVGNMIFVSDVSEFESKLA